MAKIEKIIIGSNTFEGISYLSRSQATHYLEFFSNKENIISILEAAFNIGIDTFMCSNTENIISALNDSTIGKEINLLPVIPNVYEYAREASDKGVLGTIMDRAKRIDLYQKVRFGLRALSKIKGIISKDVFSLLTELINFELLSFEKFKLSGIILHGQITDLALSSNNSDIINTYLTLIKEGYNIQPILATHNFGSLLSKLQKWKIKVPILAPFNLKGFMMRPDKEKCEELLEKTDYQIIAKKVLAGGRLTPEEAFPYLKNKNITSVVVGVGSVSEVYHTFTVAKSILKNE